MQCLFSFFTNFAPSLVILVYDIHSYLKQVEAEKPNPTIFLKACELLGVEPEDAVHVGDDRRNDVWGARDAGCDAWLWGSDVNSFKEVIMNCVKTIYTNSFVSLLNADK